MMTFFGLNSMCCLIRRRTDIEAQGGYLKMVSAILPKRRIIGPSKDLNRTRSSTWKASHRSIRKNLISIYLIWYVETFWIKTVVRRTQITVLGTSLEWRTRISTIYKQQLKVTNMCPQHGWFYPNRTNQ